MKTKLNTNHVSLLLQEGEANFNIAFASVIGSLGAIVWAVLIFYKLQHEYSVYRKRQYLSKRAHLLSKDFADTAITNEKHIELVPIEPAGSGF